MWYFIFNWRLIVIIRYEYNYNSYSLYILIQVHGLGLGAVRGGVPRHLHRQPRRLHDHQGGVDRVLRRRRHQGGLHHSNTATALSVIISHQLSNPQSLKPPLKFGTVPWTYTDNALRKHYPSMHLHMKQYNERDVREGVNSVKRGWGSFIRAVNEIPRKFSQNSEKERSFEICKVNRLPSDADREYDGSSDSSSWW